MNVLLIILGIILLLAGIGLAVLSHPAFGLWRHVSTERIQASPNYRDGMFRNQEPTPQFTGDSASTSGTLWRFLTNRDTLRVPQQPIPAVKTDLKNLPTDNDWIVWFGHSSYLFSLNGKRFLVDPVLKPEFPSSLMLKAFPGTDIYRPEDLEKVILDLQSKQVFTVHHNKYALSVHPWYEPDNVAQEIATKHNIRLLDAPIGTVVKF